MKSPVSGKEMILKEEKKTLIFKKGKDIDYNHKSYFCEESGESFTTTELDELNLKQFLNKTKNKDNN